MEIRTRKDAISRRLIRYFTGVPCRAGHISERYTKTSGCIECLHPKFEASNIEDIRRSREARKRMIKRKFRVQPAGLDQFRAFLLALSLFHESSIDLKDLEAAGPILTLANGAEIRPFWIFPQDEPALRVIEDPLFPEKPEPEPAPLELAANTDDGSWPEGDPS